MNSRDLLARVSVNLEAPFMQSTQSRSSDIASVAPSRRLSDSWVFLRRFLRDPKNVASIWPSSKVLARAMLRDLDLVDDISVVEYGPGTGAFTRLIRERLGALASWHYHGIDGDPTFCALLRERFPDLSFVNGRVEDPAMWPEDLKAPDLIISGLPLITFPVPVLEGIVRDTYARLAPGGTFRTFSYVHSIPTPGQRRLRRLMSEAFDEYHVSKPVARNIPPALVLSGTKRG